MKVYNKLTPFVKDLEKKENEPFQKIVFLLVGNEFVLNVFIEFLANLYQEV